AHERDQQVAADHREHAVGQVDESHHAQRDRQTHRDEEQQHPVGDAVEEDGRHGLRPARPAYLRGSLTLVNWSNSTLYSLPPTFFTSRTYTVCTTSRVSASISSGPR